MRVLRNEAGFKHRVLEVGLTMVASAITAAFAVTWRMSAIQTQTTMHADSLESRISHSENVLESERAINVQQGTQIAVDQSTNSEILRRLSSIETKVDIQGARINELGAQKR